MFKELTTGPEGVRWVTGISHLRPTHEVRLSALGEPLLFQTNYEPFMATAAETFGRFPLQRPDAPPLRIQMFVLPQEDKTNTNGSPSRPDQGQTYQGFAAYSQEHLVHLRIGENMSVSDVQSGYAFATISAETAQNLSFVRYVFIEGLPQILLGGRDYVAIHAACVVKNGVSLMLCAPSGTGKSTLALACSQHGYQVLTEDAVQIHIPPEPDAVRLWGIPWKFRLLPDAARFFPQLENQHPRLQANGKWKIEVELETFHPGSTLTNAPPGLVIFLERDEQNPPCLQRLSLAEALRQFEAVWTWDMPTPPYYEQQLLRLLSQGVYQLRMRGVPEETVAILDELVAEASNG